MKRNSLNKINKYKKGGDSPPMSSELKFILDSIIKEKGGDYTDYIELMNAIAFHESAHTNDPKIKQIGGGPGRGKYQFEEGKDAGGITAARRTKRYYEKKGWKIPKWLEESIQRESLDVTNLSSAQQDVLFLGNMREHPKADLGKVVKKEETIPEFWANYHWAGPDEQRNDRLKSFNKSLNYLGNKKDSYLNYDNIGDFVNATKPVKPKKPEEKNILDVLDVLDAPQKKLMKGIFNEYKKPSELLNGTEMGSQLMGKENYGLLADLVLDPLSLVPYSAAFKGINLAKKGSKAAKTFKTKENLKKAINSVWGLDKVDDVGDIYDIKGSGFTRPDYTPHITPKLQDGGKINNMRKKKYQTGGQVNPMGQLLPYLNFMMSGRGDINGLLDPSYAPGWSLMAGNGGDKNTMGYMNNLKNMNQFNANDQAHDFLMQATSKPSAGFYQQGGEAGSDLLKMYDFLGLTDQQGNSNLKHYPEESSVRKLSKNVAYSLRGSKDETKDEKTKRKAKTNRVLGAIKEAGIYDQVMNSGWDESKFDNYINEINQQEPISLSNVKDYKKIYDKLKKDFGITSDQAKKVGDAFLADKNKVQRGMYKAAVYPFLQRGGMIPTYQKGGSSGWDNLPAPLPATPGEIDHIKERRTHFNKEWENAPYGSDHRYAMADSIDVYNQKYNQWLYKHGDVSFPTEEEFQKQPAHIQEQLIKTWKRVKDARTPPQTQQRGGMINSTGYTPGTSTMKNPMNIIPGGNITMKNTPFPVLGIPNNGIPRIMQPGQDYMFGGATHVTEIPLRLNGGNVPHHGLGKWVKKQWKGVKDTVGHYANEVGKVANDAVVGAADWVGNATGLYDVSQNSYKTGIGQKAQGTWGNVAGGVGGAALGMFGIQQPGMAAAGRERDLFNNTPQPQNINQGMDLSSLLPFLPMLMGGMNQQQPDYQQYRFGLPYQAKKGGKVRKVRKYQEGGPVEMSPIQTEKGEMLIWPTGDITNVKATKLHKHMDNNHVTDLVPGDAGVYVASNHKPLTVKRDEVDFVLGMGKVEYDENMNRKIQPKEVNFNEIFNNKKKLTPAEIAKNILKTYNTTDRKDSFADRSNSENKQSRAPYLEVLRAVNDFKREGGAPQFQQGGTVPIYGDGGEGVNPDSGGGILSVIPAILNTILGGIQLGTNTNNRKRGERDAAQYYNLANANLNKGTQFGMAAAAGSALSQDPYSNRPDRSIQEATMRDMLDKTPSYIRNATANQINRPLSIMKDSAFRNSTNFGRSSAMLNNNYSQTLNSQSQAALQYGNQDIGLRNQYLGNIANLKGQMAQEFANQQNQIRTNRNTIFGNLFGNVGNLGINHYNQDSALLANKYNMKAAARGQQAAANAALFQNMSNSINMVDWSKLNSPGGQQDNSVIKPFQPFVVPTPTHSGVQYPGNMNLYYGNGYSDPNQSTYQ